MTEKKKPKRKSMTATIKSLREDLATARERHQNMWQRWRDCNQELNSLRLLIPLKYYKIDFKIKSNAGHEVEHSQVVEHYSAELAIKEVKSNKTHPDTFKLLNITLMAQ